MKKHIVINRQWIWFLLLISTFVALGILVLGDMDDIALGLLLLLLALGMLALLVWFMPLCFLFDREGVRISFDVDGELNSAWFLLRLSVHDPVMPLNAESDVPGGAKYVLGKLYEALKEQDGIDLTLLEAAL